MNRTTTVLASLMALSLSLSPTYAAATETAVMEEPVCTAEMDPAFALRKSIAVLNATISQPQQAVDMPGLGAAVSRHLQQAIARQSNLRVRDGSGHSPADTNINLLGYNDTRLDSQLTAIARELNSQLIVSSRITDLSPAPRQVSTFDRLFSRSSGPRHFAIELKVYDGYSGSEILGMHFQTQAEGRVDMRGLQPLQGDFLNSDYGSAVGGLLDAAAARLARSISCIPFMTAIIDRQGNELRIREGGDTLLRPNDRLRIFHRRYIGVDEFGRERFQEEFIGDARVSQLSPNAAVLQLEDSARQEDIRPGDVARAW